MSYTPYRDALIFRKNGRWWIGSSDYVPGQRGIAAEGGKTRKETEAMIDRMRDRKVANPATSLKSLSDASLSEKLRTARGEVRSAILKEMGQRVADEFRRNLTEAGRSGRDTHPFRAATKAKNPSAKTAYRTPTAETPKFWWVVYQLSNGLVRLVPFNDRGEAASYWSNRRTDGDVEVLRSVGITSRTLGFKEAKSFASRSYPGSPTYLDAMYGISSIGSRKTARNPSRLTRNHPPEVTADQEPTAYEIASFYRWKHRNGTVAADHLVKTARKPNFDRDRYAEYLAKSEMTSAAEGYYRNKADAKEYATLPVRRLAGEMFVDRVLSGEWK